VLIRDSVVLTAGRCLGSVSTGFSSPARVTINDTLRVTVWAGPGNPANPASTSGALEAVADAVAGSYIWLPGYAGSNIGVVTVRWRSAMATHAYVLAARSSLAVLLNDVVNSTFAYPPPLPGQAAPVQQARAGQDLYADVIDPVLLEQLNTVGFPFPATIVGYGADGGAQATVGTNRFVHRWADMSITNRTYVTLLTADCRKTARGGSWQASTPSALTGAQACISGGDLGAPLFAQYQGSTYVIGIAESGDSAPCSLTRTWFTSVLFRSEFLRRQLSFLETGQDSPCPSATPTATSTPTPSPTPTPTPTVSPSQSTIPIVVLPPPPPPPPEPFPWAFTIMVALAVIALMLCLLLSLFLLMRAEGHRRIKPTRFADLVVAKPEDRTLRQEKREEMQAHAELQEDHNPAECEQCKQLNAEKQEKQAMVEAGLAEASESDSGSDDDTDDDKQDAQAEHEGTAASSIQNSRAVVGAFPIRELPADIEQQHTVLSPEGTVAVVVDDGQRQVFLPDAAFEWQRTHKPQAAVSGPPAEHAWFHDRPEPARSVLTATRSKSTMKPAALDTIFASKDDVVPFRIHSDPRGIAHIVPGPLYSLLLRVQASCCEYLGRSTDVAKLRGAFAAQDWQGVAAVAAQMEQHQRVALDRQAAASVSGSRAGTTGPTVKSSASRP
jgi:hypothetical protein